MAHETERHVREKLDHARAFEERTEQDKKEDIGSRNVDRNAVDTLGAVGHMVDDLVEPVAPVVERAGQMLAEEAVSQKQPGDDWQRRPHDDPGGGKHRRKCNDAEDDVAGERKAGALDQRHIFPPLVEGDRHAQYAQRPCQDAHGEGLAGHRRHKREGKQNKEADVKGAHHLTWQVDDVRSRCQLVDGESHGDPEQDLSFTRQREAAMGGIVNGGCCLVGRTAGRCARHGVLRNLRCKSTRRPAQSAPVPSLSKVRLYRRPASL
jgi:hypothetical protein